MDQPEGRGGEREMSDQAGEWYGGDESNAESTFFDSNAW
jgi:hypothetical protein